VAPRAARPTAGRIAIDSETLKLITIPLFTGVIGYVINWTGFCEVCLPLHTAELDALPGAGPASGGGPGPHGLEPPRPDEEPAGGG
jgi:hypothetical protein